MFVPKIPWHEIAMSDPEWHERPAPESYEAFKEEVLSRYGFKEGEPSGDTIRICALMAWSQRQPVSFTYWHISMRIMCGIMVKIACDAVRSDEA